MKNTNTFTLEFLIHCILSIVMLFLLLILFFHQTKPFEISSFNRRDWFYISLILIFSFFLYLSLSSKYKELKKPILYISILIFLATTIYYYLMVKTSASVSYQTTLSLFVSSLFICAGWWIQSTINRSAQRKSHTLNLIMNQRFSSLFMGKNDSTVKAFGLDVTVHPEWPVVVFKNITSEKPMLKNFSYANEYHAYLDGIKGLSYLLNFYEFAAVGILKGDLDDQMMRDCFSGAICRIEKRAFFLIRYSISKDPRSYENFLKLIERWGFESLVLKHKKNTDDTICNDSSFKEIFKISKQPIDFYVKN